MFRTFTVLLALCCFTACAQFRIREIPKGVRHAMKRDVLLEKVRKASDPKGLAKNWKTVILKMEMEAPMQQLMMSTTAMYKFPDKSKVVAAIPGVTAVTEVFNGEKAWKETAGLGIQMKTGVQLAFAEFDCKKSNPALSLTEIYEKVELDPYLYKIGKFNCYKLICTLPPELGVGPAQLFVDNKEFLLRCSIENQLSEMGALPVMIKVSDYKTIEGVKMPMHMLTDMLGIKLNAEILSVKVNEKIPDTEFEFPAAKVKK